MMSTRKAARKLAEALDMMSGLVSGILERESSHLAMIETLNDRDEVFAKLVALNARLSAEFAAMLDRPDLIEELTDTVEMAGAVIEQINVEFRRKT